ncbi:hypothetical protein BMS3Abin15_00773 [bacterium BMS3Abin15]|nr:hypothetical protein BMS3Abin15_00773 [bacterium BMS3Abin15]HDZ85629.1 hypothetical protein [Candidatus Moranbacteria bacterium]
MSGKNQKDKIRNTGISLAEKIENFRYSDSVSATATKFLLMLLAMGGLVFIGAVAANTLKALDGLGQQSNDGKRKSYNKRQISNALSSLKKRKFIKIIKENNGKTRVKLTNKGKKRVTEFILNDITISKPKNWDGKWRIVIFDIPIDRDRARGALRRKIKELGFRQLQKSVWIFPYECEDEILFISEIFRITKYVEIFTVDKMLHEKEIRRAFKL